MTKCQVNGVNYDVPDGCSINIVGNTVTINGGASSITIGSNDSVVFNGNVGNITCDKSVNVTGTVTGNVECRGSFNGDNVEGDVKAGGSVNCDDIGGNVQAGGSINADTIKGEAKRSKW